MAIYKEDWQIPGHWFDYFEFLNINENAKEEEIKRAYRKMAKKYHPDMHSGDQVAEEKFKKAQIAYNVLSDAYRRNEYLNDYMQRKVKSTQSGASFKNNNTESTKNPQNNNPDNNQQNFYNTNAESSIDFDDILQNYKQNPNDEDINKMAKKAIRIIIDSFNEYAQLFDETYQEFYNSLFCGDLDEDSYIINRDELKSLILEQMNIIQEFTKKSMFIIQNQKMTEEKEKLNKIISEYQNKLKILSKNYKKALKFQEKMNKIQLKKYYIDNELLKVEFVQKLKRVDNQFSKIRESIENDTIDDKTKRELSQVLEEYNKILDWIFKIHDFRNSRYVNEINNATIHLLHNYEEELKLKTELIKNLVKNFDAILFTSDLLKKAEQFYQELMQYHDLEKLEKMIANGILDKIKYENLVIDFNEEFKKLCDEISCGEKKFFWKNNKKWKELKLLKTNIDSIMEDGIILNYSYDDILYSIQRKKEQELYFKELEEGEKTAKQLIKELQPAIDFLTNMDIKFNSYNDLKTKIFQKIKKLLILCNDVNIKMQAIPFFNDKKNNMNLFVYGLNCDCNQALSTLNVFSVYIEKMISFENYIAFCSINNKELKKLFDNLKQTFEFLEKEQNSQKFSFYKSLIDEINMLLKERENKLLIIDNNALQEYSKNNSFLEQRELEQGIRYFYLTRHNHTFDYCSLFRKLDLTSYQYNNMLQQNIVNWIESHSLKFVNKMQLKQKLKNIQEKAMQTFNDINRLLDNSYQGIFVNWQEIIVNKEVLENLLNEMNQIFIHNNNQIEAEFLEIYWQFYQQLNMNISKIPESKDKFIEQFKLKTLELLNRHNQNKKQIKERDTLTDDELKDYISNFYEYNIAVETIKILTDSSENKTSELLKVKEKILQMTIQELLSLKFKNSFVTELENKYGQELKKVQKELYYIQNKDQCNNIELQWQCHELEESLEKEPTNENLLKKYLEIVGKIAEEEYLHTYLGTQEETFSSTIKKIKAQKVYFTTQKNVLQQHLLKIPDMLREQELYIIDEGLEDCEAQLRILNL